MACRKSRSSIRVGRLRLRLGLTEDTQARWVARMYLVNLMEQVRLTNWYCLFDVGGDDAEMEHRFGLVRLDGTRRPAYQAYKILARQLGAMSLKQVIARFNQRTAQGASALVFCDTRSAASSPSGRPKAVSAAHDLGAGLAAYRSGHRLPRPRGRITISAGGVLEVEVQTAVRYVRLRRSHRCKMTRACDENPPHM